MKYDPLTHEQIFVLKDGRTIFKTHNGFKAWMTDTKGVTIPTTLEYYTKLKFNKI